MLSQWKSPQILALLLKLQDAIFGSKVIYVLETVTNEIVYHIVLVKMFSFIDVFNVHFYRIFEFQPTKEFNKA